MTAIAVTTLMYAGWATAAVFNVPIVDSSNGVMASLNSVYWQVDGEHTYVYLQGECGTPVMVRISIYMPALPPPHPACQILCQSVCLGVHGEVSVSPMNTLRVQ